MKGAAAAAAPLSSRAPAPGQGAPAQQRIRRECEQCARPFHVARQSSQRRLCTHCAYRPSARRARRRKYVWTEQAEQLLRDSYDGKIYGRAAELAAVLGFPAWEVKHHAARLGLTYTQDRHEWKPEELRELLSWVGDRDVKWISRRLKRSVTSVVLKLKRLKIRRRCTEGYTLRRLCDCFGVDHHGIEGWVKRGWLPMRYGIPAGANRRWKLHQAEVVAFIREHPMEYRLDKVDQAWFLGLLLGKDLGA